VNANYQACLGRILAYEGGKVNNPKDPGGKTNQGVTQTTYNAWLTTNGRPDMDVYNMPNADRDAIYKGEYWDRVQGDALPMGLDLVVFDAAVNSGPAQAIKWLQSAINSPDVRVDGVMGVKTLAAIGNPSDTQDLVEEVCAHRLATLQQLKTWSTFGKGWSARIANVQKTALSWISQAPTPSAPDLSGVSGAAKAPVVGNVKPPVISEIASHGITAGGAVATVTTQAATGLSPVVDTFWWLKYVIGGLTVASVIAGILVAVSTNAKAAALAGTAKATVDLDADTQLPAVPDVKVGA
jgi:lysozyme family protein